MVSPPRESRVGLDCVESFSISRYRVPRQTFQLSSLLVKSHGPRAAVREIDLLCGDSTSPRRYHEFHLNRSGDSLRDGSLAVIINKALL